MKLKNLLSILLLMLLHYAAQAGTVLPQPTPITPSGYIHVLKDFNDNSLTGNNFYGQAGVGASSTNGVFTATVSQALYTPGYTGSAVQITYNVSTANSFVYYNNLLSLNSVKSKFVIFLKGGSANPGTVKLEIHDKNWTVNGGGAIAYLQGITTNWQEWVVNINSADVTPNGSGYDPTSVKEIVVTITNADATSKSGTLYIDDMSFADATNTLTPYPGHALPETSPITPSGYIHVLKDFNDGSLTKNNFYGNASVGSSSNLVNGTYVPTASINQTIFTPGYTGSALKLTYDVSNAGTYVYYSNLLSMNSVKNKFVIYLKGDSTNPGTVKLEIHDKNWTVNGGGATVMLHGITTNWQQWVVSLKPADVTPNGSGYDPTSVKEIVVTTTNDDAVSKTGTFYIDDMSFADSTNTLTPYPGHALPETSPITPSGYIHVLKDFNDGTLTKNNFYGNVSVGSSSNLVNGTYVPTASINQTIFTPGYTGSALKLTYDVSNAGTYVYYSNLLSMNSVKNKFVIYLKGDSTNPGTVKLEIHDKNWTVNGGGATVMLHGITTNWQQWVVSLKPADVTPNGSGYDPTSVKEIVVTTTNDDAVSKTGTFYIDDMSFADSTNTLTPYPGHALPETSPITPSGYIHVLKDFNDGTLSKNNFYGNVSVGSSSNLVNGTYVPTASINQAIFTPGYTGSALKLTYDVSNAGTYVYYSNLLSMNSVKTKFVIYLKGDNSNPGTVKLEIHDKNWTVNGGGATVMLHGITTNWQQWVVSLNPADVTPNGSGYDPTSVKEIVVTTTNDDAVSKTGAFYIDDMSFADSTNTLTPYPGHALPETSPITPSGYIHVLKDFNDGTLTKNNFYGNVSVGSSSNLVNGTYVPTASINQTIFTPGYTGSALKLTYDVSNAGTYVYYSNLLSMNSVKNKFVIYLKGDSTNPGTVKLEIHDKNWTVNGGGATVMLHGITTNWQQWVVSLKPADVTPNGSGYDPTSVKEIVVTTTNDDAVSKTGAFYIDDMSFADSTNTLTPYPGLAFPEANSAINLKDIAIPYQIDDFDGRVINPDGSVDRNFNDFFGYGGAYAEKSYDSINLSISSTASNGEAHTKPFSEKISYNFKNIDTSRMVMYYSSLMLNVDTGQSHNFANFSGMNKIALWLRSDTDKNPGTVIFILKDSAFNSAQCMLTGISSNQWKLYEIPFDSTGLSIPSGFNFSKIREYDIMIEYAFANAKQGDVYIDDVNMLDTTRKFVTSSDFDISNKNNAFLDLLEQRTFNYFWKNFEPTTGLVRDRITYNDLASVGATGWGLSALPIGVQHGWITRAQGEAMVLKTLNTLWNAKQGTDTIGTNGYKGFFYHYLEITTGLRYMPVWMWPATSRSGRSELSIIDSEILLEGILTCKKYFSSNAQISALADSIYNRMDWKWFLDQTNPGTNPNYNQFHMSWEPDLKSDNSGLAGFSGYWNTFTDEATMINLTAIGSPTHPVSTSVFYTPERMQGHYNGRGLTMSYNGSLFQYFFAHCWYDLSGKKDSLNLNFYANAIQAGLANRDFCIAGKDNTGRTVPTYNANSWGLSACDGVPAGIGYLGPNGALPNIYNASTGKLDPSIDGTVPPYGGISMLGFCDASGLMPVSYISGLLQNYYRNTQLWTGYYGLRDSYTDTAVVKPGATSKFPMYRNDHVAIDQGPLLLMIENYRTGLIRQYFMQNTSVQNAVNKIFTAAGTPEAPTATNVGINANHYVSQFMDNFDGTSLGEVWSTPTPQYYTISTDNVKNGDGTKCLRIDYNKSDANSAWTFIQGQFPSAMDFSAYNTLQFKAAASNLTFTVKIQDSNGNGPEGTFTATGNTWQTFSFTLSDPNFVSSIKDIQKIVIIPDGPATGISGTLYIDEIKLIQNQTLDAIYNYIPVAGDSLIGNYTYSDPNGDAEQGSTYRWLSSTAYDGTYTAISGATQSYYIMKSSDVGKYLKFEVTPMNSVAPTTGIAVQSLPTRVSTYFDLHLTDIPYSAEQSTNYSGAACAKMVLNYEGNSTITQPSFQTYGTEHNTTPNLNATFIDPTGMATGLNNFKGNANYNYAQLPETSLSNACNDICYWISYSVPGVPKVHMPGIVPKGGNFSNWMLVNGFQASGDPHLVSSYSIFGFYVEDPDSIGGLGQDVFIQASVFTNNYFLPVVSSDSWNGKYVSVLEPPVTKKVAMSSTMPFSQAPTTNELRYEAAEAGLNNYHLSNDIRIGNAYSGAVRGRIYFVNLPGTINDYYIVTFEKNGEPVVAVTVDANNGAVKEVTYSATPDANYYNYLAGKGYTRLKSASAYSQSAFYPSVGSLSNITDDSDTTTITNTGVTNSFIVWPNPAGDYTNVTYTVRNSGNVNMCIYDLYGRLIKTVVNNNQIPGTYDLKVDLQDMNDGIYFLRLTTGSEKNVAKLVVRK